MPGGETTLFSTSATHSRTPSTFGLTHRDQCPAIAGQVDSGLRTRRQGTRREDLSPGDSIDGRGQNLLGAVVESDECRGRPIGRRHVGNSGHSRPGTRRGYANRHVVKAFLRDGIGEPTVEVPAAARGPV